MGSVPLELSLRLVPRVGAGQWIHRVFGKLILVVGKPHAYVIGITDIAAAHGRMMYLSGKH